MREILNQIGFSQCKCVEILCDNSSSIKLSKNPVMHRRTKHIDVRYHFLRDLTNEGAVKLIFCGTENQVADIMMKPVKLDTFMKLRQLLGVQALTD